MLDFLLTCVVCSSAGNRELAVSTDDLDSTRTYPHSSAALQKYWAKRIIQHNKSFFSLSSLFSPDDNQGTLICRLPSCSSGNGNYKRGVNVIHT